MNKQEMKRFLNKEMLLLGFRIVPGGWLLEQDSMPRKSIFATLTKARYGEEYHFWIKLFQDGVFEIPIPAVSKMLREEATVFRVEQKDYLKYFSFADGSIGDVERKEGISEFLHAILEPFVAIAFQKHGIRLLFERGFVFVTPALKTELARIGCW